jgi:hypothetical protein
MPEWLTDRSADVYDWHHVFCPSALALSRRHRSAEARGQPGPGMRNEMTFEVLLPICVGTAALTWPVVVAAVAFVDERQAPSTSAPQGFGGSRESSSQKFDRTATKRLIPREQGRDGLGDEATGGRRRRGGGRAAHRSGVRTDAQNAAGAGATAGGVGKSPLCVVHATVRPGALRISFLQFGGR